MSESDLYISNGTCYFAPGQVSDDRFIPCGNAALSGPQSCCFQGDFCLSTGTCWDNMTIVTYTAGCTDSSYSSSKCIDKREYPDQQWVAIARCEGDDVEIWSGCAYHPEYITIEKENCECNASEPLIRNPNGQSTLDEIASLPPTAGGQISFNPTAIPTFESQDGGSSTPASGAATATSTPDNGGGNDLSTGAKAGIGVGAGIGGILLLVIAFWVYKLLQRRKTMGQQQRQDGQGSYPPGVVPGPGAEYPNADRSHSFSPSSPGMTQYVSAEGGGHEDGSNKYGHKQELSADSSYRPELQGDWRHGGMTELQG